MKKSYQFDNLFIIDGGHELRFIGVYVLCGEVFVVERTQTHGKAEKNPGDEANSEWRGKWISSHIEEKKKRNIRHHRGAK